MITNGMLLSHLLEIERAREKEVSPKKAVRGYRITQYTIHNTQLTEERKTEGGAEREPGLNHLPSYLLRSQYAIWDDCVPELEGGGDELLVEERE